MILGIGLMFLAIVVKAQDEVKYFKGTYDEALELAAKQNKPIFIKTYTDWCYYCKKMDKKTMVDEKIVRTLNEQFITLAINMEAEAGLELDEKFNISAYPTLLVIGSDGKMLAKLVGYHKALELQAELEKALPY